MTAEVCAEITVSGLVQGVGYRYFAQKEALALDLCGYVMNMADGRSVKVMVSGGKAAVEKFLAELEKGPPLGRVLSVDTEWKTAPLSVKGFSIKY